MELREFIDMLEGKATMYAVDNRLDELKIEIVVEKEIHINDSGCGEETYRPQINVKIKN